MIEFEALPKITPAPISLVFLNFDTNCEVARELQEWIDVLTGVGNGHEIIAVGGGFDANFAPHVKVLTTEMPGSFGACLRAGIAAAQHPLLLYVRGGEGYAPSALKAMLKWIDEVHLVAGYRIASRKPQRAFRSTWLRRRFARTVFGVHMRDLGCHYLLARQSIFARIPIQSTSSFAHVEVLAKANFLGCMMTEVPVTYGGERVGREDRSRLRADALRVFQNPDFGPVSVS